MIEGGNGLLLSDDGYNIQCSLRFRSSASAYLNRTPASAGNRQTWTWSGWVKRGKLGSAQAVFMCNTGNPQTSAWFNASDNLTFFNYTSGATYDWEVSTSQVFRDPSAWYHLVFVVDTTQATASNRIKIYVNGSQVTALSTATYPSQNFNSSWNNTVSHAIGRDPAGSWYFDGYLAEVNFIDGQALTPTSFGETDAVTGVWKPKKYAGTYGTNGFYLPFSDNTSATTLAYDKSGNGNNWTANNISTTAGATYDSMTDVPTLTSATAANYCVLNPLDEGTNLSTSNANLSVADSTTEANHRMIRSTFGVSTGKFYWEVNVNNSAFIDIVGIADASASINSYVGGSGSSVGWGYSTSTGSYYATGGWSSSGTASAFPSSGIIGVALDVDSGKMWVSSNGTWATAAGGVGVPSSGTNPTFTYSGSATTFFPAVSIYNNTGTWSFNFGQRPFSYTPPTGFKALNTFNLPDPTIKKPNQYMDATTYTGTAATQSIVNSGSMQPDMIWFKCRNYTYDHTVWDTVRGLGKLIIPNKTNAEVTSISDALTSFNSNGFTLGADINGIVNDINRPFVAWQWKESATAGFDIVTFTGNGTAGRTVSHSLGITPAMMIIKSRSNARTWAVYHKNLTSAAYYLGLETTNAQLVDNTMFNSTAPTSSVFSVGTYQNANAENYVAYLFAEIAGFSKFGSYTGNGSADGPFVYCGFRPKYVIRKRTDSTGSWLAQDSVRPGYNANINYTSVLYPNTSDAEIIYNEIDITSNGFKIRANDTFGNASGGTYVFVAFAENPFKYSLAR